MAQGIYKSGEQINLVYQAINCLSGAIPVGTVLDEGGAVDAPKSTSLTSQLLLGEKTGVAAGRYHGHFTPDAEGRWTVVIQDKNGDGEVSKVYSVTGHNIDEVGDDAVLAKNNADSACNAADSALAASKSALAQADSAANAAQSALAKAASAAAYAASGATAAAVAAIGASAMVS